MLGLICWQTLHMMSNLLCEYSSRPAVHPVGGKDAGCGCDGRRWLWIGRDIGGTFGG